jgi:hypothetical protein
MNEKFDISFADLKHKEQPCNYIPLGIARVAATAMTRFEDIFEAEVFKSPFDYQDYLKKRTPKIACFSNYIWNTNISCQFAKRIKKENSETIIVFGGVNYPVDPIEQEQFLKEHPEIDFYIFRDGEKPFIELVNQILLYDFNIEKLKSDRVAVSNCHYLHESDFVRGTLATRMKNLDEIPSPYLSGLCDKFFDNELIAMIETARGCPFTCSFCQDGNEYYSRVARFSLDRIQEELSYISTRVKTPSLMIADLNFGMYREDIEVCKFLSSLQGQYSWPKYIGGIAGKNQKERVLEAASIIDGADLGAAVQSTNDGVLGNVKRKNIRFEDMIMVAKEGEHLGADSYSEIILGLPGDTKETHIQSVTDLIDADINTVRSHQLIMLHGAELASKESRRDYKLSTRYRVMPYTVAEYELYGEQFVAEEVDEIVVASDSMSFEDYLECRLLNLTVEIFYNGRVFYELIKLLKQHSVLVSDFIKSVHDTATKQGGSLTDIYTAFLSDNKEIWNTKEELTKFLEEPGSIDRYLNKELGINEQLVYRAVSFFGKMDFLHEIAYVVAKDCFARTGALTSEFERYLDESKRMSILRKVDLLSTSSSVTELFHYDFSIITKESFNGDPLDYYAPEGIYFEVRHSEEQEKLIAQYVEMFGSSNYGLGNLLSHISHVAHLYRDIKLVSRH